MKTKKNSVRYFLFIFFCFLFLFVSNDFGLIDIEKTAIVLSVGIDKKDEDFFVTAQIAVPEKNGNTGKAKNVEILGTGRTVAEAMKNINAKTGWYPKLVFCDVIVIGEDTAKQNVFDILDYFLKEEYMSDACTVATCEGEAGKLLSVKTPMEQLSAIEIQKLISDHSAKSGLVVQSSLRTFAIGYYGISASGYLPVLKKKPLTTEKDEQTGGSNENQSDGGEGEKDKKPSVFTANDTALFSDGKQVAVLDSDETFAYSAVCSDLRLAPYLTEYDDNYYSLIITKNKPTLRLIFENDRPVLKIDVELMAALTDSSVAQPIEKVSGRINRA